MFDRMCFAAGTAIGLAWLSAACGGSTALTEVTTGPGPARCQTAVSAPPQSVSADGTSVTLTVLAARECSWSATTEASWIQVSPSAGQGEGPLTVTVSANPQASPRTTAVVINENRLSIAQEAAPCRFGLSGAPTIGAQGGRATVGLTATEGCSWTASSNAVWARLLATSGSGSTSIGVEVSANPGPARTATLTIAGLTFVLTQDTAGTAPPPAPAPAPGDPAPGGEEGEKVELAGRAVLVGGSCPNLEFLVNLRLVFTTAQTRFKSGSCRDVRNGTDVSVEGRMQSDGRIRATDVRIRDDDDDD